MAPMRANLRPRTTRQMAPKRARSARNSSLSGSVVCDFVSVYLMPYCLQVVAVRHLAAERVAPILDRHVLRVVREGMDQHGHVQFGPAHGVGDGALVAKVGQRDQHAVDFVAVGAEQVGAAAGFFNALNAAVARFLRRERNHIDAFLLQHLKHGLAAGVTEVRREKAAVADNHAQGQGLSGYVHGSLQYVFETAIE